MQNACRIFWRDSVILQLESCSQSNENEPKPKARTFAKQETIAWETEIPENLNVKYVSW